MGGDEGRGGEKRGGELKCYRHTDIQTYRQTETDIQTLQRSGSKLQKKEIKKFDRQLTLGIIIDNPGLSHK